MKVALLTPWFVSEKSVGGTERFVNDLAYSLIDNNYEVDVYMLSGKSYKHKNINYISLKNEQKNVLKYNLEFEKIFQKEIFNLIKGQYLF